MARMVWLVPALGLALAGCGGQRNSVSGTVRYEGRPVPSGTVKFHRADGEVWYGSIHGEGQFTVDDAPLGPVRITVQTHDATPRLPQSGVAPKQPAELAPRKEDRRDARAVPIPARYREPEKSGLTYTVRGGSQTHDIDLKP